MDLSNTQQSKRPLGIGGTDIAAILGLSSYKTPLEVWTRLISGNEYSPDLLHLRFGQHAESFIANEYERATRLKTHSHPEPIFHPQHGFMFGHVDRLVSESGESAVVSGKINTNRLLECKTTSAFNRSEWGDEGSDQIPSTYLMQCAWYLAITRCEVADVAVLLGNNDFRIYHIKRDLELEDLLLMHAQRFWSDHVLTMSPPKPITCEDAALLFPKNDANSEIEADDQISQALEHYREKLSQANALSDECERLKTEILTYMGHSERLCFRGKTLATWKCAKPSQRIDTKALAAAHPEIAANFTHQTLGSRRFLLKDAA